MEQIDYARQGSERCSSLTRDLPNPKRWSLVKERSNSCGCSRTFQANEWFVIPPRIGLRSVSLHEHRRVLERETEVAGGVPVIEIPFAQPVAGGRWDIRSDDQDRQITDFAKIVRPTLDVSWIDGILDLHENEGELSLWRRDFNDRIRTKRRSCLVWIDELVSQGQLPIRGERFAQNRLDRAQGVVFSSIKPPVPFHMEQAITWNTISSRSPRQGPNGPWTVQLSNFP